MKLRIEKNERPIVGENEEINSGLRASTLYSYISDIVGKVGNYLRKKKNQQGHLSATSDQNPLHPVLVESSSRVLAKTHNVDARECELPRKIFFSNIFATFFFLSTKFVCIEKLKNKTEICDRFTF